MPPGPESDSSARILSAIAAKDNDAMLRQIREKAALDKDLADHLHFFALLQIEMKRKQELAALLQELEQAAKLSGFTDLNQALNQAKNADGQSPLQQAFQQQKFDDAAKLIDAGAIPGPVERAAFEIALDSKAAKDFGLSSPQAVEKQHLVKDYGLVLGIAMTSKDGTYSQLGHIGPCYQLLTDAVDKHAKTNPQFAEIADAYKFSNKAAAFSASTSQRNPEAGQEISQRIQDGKITTIPISFSGHTMGLSVVPDGPDSKAGYLVFTNKGLGSKPGESGTQIYRVEDLSKLDEHFVNTVMNGHADGVPHEQIMGMITKVTDGAPPIHSIAQKAQTVDNCSVVNSRSNVEGILLCQQARDKGGFDKLNQDDFDVAKKNFKEFTHAMKLDKVNDLVSALKKDPNNEDLNNLAKEYLKQHPNAGAELREPLERALDAVHQQQVSLGKNEFLKPLPNTISTAVKAVESPQLSTPETKSTADVVLEVPSSENVETENTSFQRSG